MKKAVKNTKLIILRVKVTKQRKRQPFQTISCVFDAMILQSFLRLTLYLHVFDARISHVSSYIRRISCIFFLYDLYIIYCHWFGSRCPFVSYLKLWYSCHLFIFICISTYSPVLYVVFKS